MRLWAFPLSTTQTVTLPNKHIQHYFSLFSEICILR
nr:MAG TPA: hypothetical protein [Caudoviricetes sp.]